MSTYGDGSMKFSEKLNYYLSRNFKNSEALEFLNMKLCKHPYDYFKFVSFLDESYKTFYQGAIIDYRVDPNNPRDITVTMDIIDRYTKNKIIFEIRKFGNEVNLITCSPKENTSLFHIRYNRDNTINVLNKVIKFFNSDKEETIGTVFSKFDNEGILLDFKTSDEMSDNVNQSRRRFV